MQVVFTQAAEADLERIGDYIAEDSPGRAVSFVQELHKRCLGIADMPKAYPLLPRHEITGIRRRVHGNYLIFYQVIGESVAILRILHGAQDYDAILFPEN